MKRTISRNRLLSLLLIACLVLATALPLGVLADGEKKEDITQKEIDEIMDIFVDEDGVIFEK